MGSEAAHLFPDAHQVASETTKATRAALTGIATVSSALVDASTLAQSRQLPVADGVASLFPDPTRAGLTRGSTIGVVGNQGCVALTFALLAEAMREGSWVAVVDSPWLGLAALAGLGLPLQQLVMVERTDAHWGSVMAALVDGFDLVVYSSRSVGERDHRRIRAHVREKGSVLVQIGERNQRSTQAAVDLRFEVADVDWFGLGQGHGHLARRQVQVEVSGRRQRRHRSGPLWLPDAAGLIRPVTPEELSGSSEEGDAARWAGSDIDHLLTVDRTQEPVANADAGSHLRRVQ